MALVLVSVCTTRLWRAKPAPDLRAKHYAFLDFTDVVVVSQHRW